MPQPKTQARVFAVRDDVARQNQAAGDRIDASWAEIKERLDLDDPVRPEHVDSTRADLNRLGNNQVTVNILEEIVRCLRKHDIDVTRRGGLR